MQADQLQQDRVQSFLDMPGSMDKPRGLSLTKVRVTNDKCMNLQVGRHMVPRGTHEVLLYQDELTAARDLLLETRPDAVKAAEVAYEMEIAQEAADLLGYTGDLETLLAKYKGGAEQHITDAFTRAKATTAHSVEACFHAVNKRSVKPLSAVEEIAGDIPEPQREKAVGEQNAMAEIIAKAVAGAIAQNEQAMQARIDAAVAKALSNTQGKR